MQNELQKILMKTSSELATLFIWCQKSLVVIWERFLPHFINTAAPLKVPTDYDLNEFMLMNMTSNLPRIDNFYRLVIQRFADFHGLLFSSLNLEDFTDSNVALFLHDAGVCSSHHVSCEKTF